MSVNVTIRLKAIGDLRRRERIEIGSEIRSSIVGGCSHSMKDEEKARDARLFSFMRPFFDFVSSEKRVSPFEKRGELVVSIVHFIGGRILYFGSGIIFFILHRTSHTRLRFYTHERTRRARPQSAVQSDFTLYKHPIGFSVTNHAL